MPNILPKFDTVRHRNDPARVAHRFAQLWPNRKTRRAIAQQFADSIRAAHAESEASWSVSVLARSLRLNAGQVEVITASANEVSWLVRTKGRKRFYPAVKVASDKVALALNKITSIPSALRTAHRDFVVNAASSKPSSPFAKSFSEAAVTEIEKILEADLPRPSYQDRTLHILQGGTTNGDRAWLEKAARLGLKSQSWVVPKAAKTGDDAILYVGQEFFAVARIAGGTRPKHDRQNRYGAPIDKVELLRTPISIRDIKEQILELKWAIQPRSVQTPSPRIRIKLRDLITRHKMRRISHVRNSRDHSSRHDISDEELRLLAVAAARGRVPGTLRLVTVRDRSRIIHQHVVRRSKGICEGCREEAPFDRIDGTPYLEPHHKLHLGRDDGPDDPWTVIALCPNCHRRVHHAQEGDDYNRRLRSRLKTLEKSL